VIKDRDTALAIALVVTIAVAGYVWLRIAEARWRRETRLEFARDFPGVCIVCSFHRWGYQQGFERSPRPEWHDCGRVVADLARLAKESPR